MDTPRGPARLALLLLAVLAAVVVWTAWPRGGAAIRPDTGQVAASLDPAATEDVLRTLLERVYAAFGEQEEGAIYDGLATAVASDLLADLYLQRRAAQLTEPDAAEGKTVITDLTLNEWRLLDRADRSYRIAADWTVTGIVGHQDHRHERVNAYAATLTLGPSQGEWRLTGFDLDQVQRKAPPPIFFEDLDFGSPESTAE